MLTLLKYGTHECSICHAMADYDSRIAKELGLGFVEVDLMAPEIYRRYRAVLLHQHPLKQELRIPAYVLVEEPEGSFRIHGEISGDIPEDRFRALLQELITSSHTGV